MYKAGPSFERRAEHRCLEECDLCKVTLVGTELWTTVNLCFLWPSVDHPIPTFYCLPTSLINHTKPFLCVFPSLPSLLVVKIEVVPVQPCCFVLQGHLGLIVTITPCRQLPSNYPSLPPGRMQLQATGRMAMSCSAVACLSLWAQSALPCEATELLKAPEAFWWHGECWNCAQAHLRVAWHHLSAR